MPNTDPYLEKLWSDLLEATIAGEPMELSEADERALLAYLFGKPTDEDEPTIPYGMSERQYRDYQRAERDTIYFQKYGRSPEKVCRECGWTEVPVLAGYCSLHSPKV